MSSPAEAAAAATGGAAEPPPSPLRCKVIVRSRHARTPWERLCKMVVGDPVHMDIVLAKPQSSSARFCFSSYVSQEFEMCLMSTGQIMDESVVNQCLEVTEQEYDRCMQFVLALVDGKTKYDYMDALMLMPMAPKASLCMLLRLCCSAHQQLLPPPPQGRNAMRYSSVLKAIVQDVEQQQQQQPPCRKVFCSQSVVLMLRQCLDDGGRHRDLIARLRLMNSRLVSPKMIFDHLSIHPFTSLLSNSELQQLSCSLAPREAAK